ncbi:hypothetical protein [Nocardia macrotermitis]|uniref:Uncharacterized protein n=1 Tax=Nocardia macrotermitis TaxID=2585198 RepID=A0A7K0D520_9NOCA|nr:hypothetical protein [Nocardia macrotermitis]MQY20651.1 hypothetical protein [Nocardia macrotermitis]
MKRRIKAAVPACAAGALAPLLFTTAAQADGPVYFSMNSGSFQCAISPDGSVGCDTSAKMMSMKIGGGNLMLPFRVSQVVIDVPWAPAHPGFAAGAVYTRSGGNPDISTLATGHDMWGPSITYAGATCAEGFHGSVSCQSKGHSWSYYEMITAS